MDVRGGEIILVAVNLVSFPGELSGLLIDNFLGIELAIAAGAIEHGCCRSAG